MMVVHDVHIVGLGASTSIGRDAWSSAAAARAGVSGFCEHPFMVDTAGERMHVAMAPWLDVDLHGQGRFEALLFPAIEQALAPLEADDAATCRVAIVLGLPAVRPGLSASLGQEIRKALAARFHGRFVASATFSLGHAGPLFGMRAALERMGQDAFDACVVAGVESYLAPETLEWIEGQDQFHGAGPLNNAWGFIPGEAAGAFLLMNRREMERWSVEPLGRVLSVGTSVEVNRIKTKTVCIGEGLTAAFREALGALPIGAKVTDMYCDMNGEPYRADEFGFAAVRTKDAFESVSTFVASADSWGDVAAASVPLAVMQATVAARKSYSNGPYGFVWSSSEGGERGSALIELPVIRPE